MNYEYDDESYTCFPEPHPNHISIEKNEQSISHFQARGVLEAESLPARKSQSDNMPARYPLASNALIPADISDPAAAKPTGLTGSRKDSKERQALHNELLLNFNTRKSVLPNTELNRVLRERREKERNRERDVQNSPKRRTSLEIKLEERANRIQEEEDRRMRLIPEEIQTHELTRVHRMITLKSTQSIE